MCSIWRYSTLKSILLLYCQLNMVYMGEAQRRCVYHHTTLKDLAFKVAGGGGRGGGGGNSNIKACTMDCWSTGLAMITTQT